MFERILGQNAPDLFIKPTDQFNGNVNSRQRTMKKIEPLPLAEESIKKGKRLIYSNGKLWFSNDLIYFVL